jgi:hypothetical protein
MSSKGKALVLGTLKMLPQGERRHKALDKDGVRQAEFTKWSLALQAMSRRKLGRQGPILGGLGSLGTAGEQLPSGEGGAHHMELHKGLLATLAVSLLPPR